MGFASSLLPRFLLAIPPVFVFLFALKLLDSYQVVSRRQIFRSVAWGVLAAAFCYLADSRPDRHTRLFAPVLEELCKAGYLIWLLRTARAGFVVDAAIYGFAVGAGFSLVENLYYIRLLSSSTLAVWALRGFGTAMMHGGATSIVGTIAASGPDHSLRHVSFGVLLAIGVHLAWNMALLSPLEASLSVLVVLPLVFVPIFIHSENSLHRWMGDKLDADLELLRMISAGEPDDSRAGKYLRSLQTSFPPAVQRDMFAILELSAQLSGGAKGNMIRRAAGMPEVPDASVGPQLTELEHLEKRIGVAGRYALVPLRTRSSRDLWEIYRLKRQ